jgi:large subunit ribosomal protein L5
MTERGTKRSSAAAAEPADAETIEMTEQPEVTGDAAVGEQGGVAPTDAPVMAEATDFAEDAAATDVAEPPEVTDVPEPAAATDVAEPAAAESSAAPEYAPYAPVTEPAADEAPASAAEQADEAPIAAPTEELAAEEAPKRGSGAAATEPRPSGPRGLRVRYSSEVVPALIKQFEYANPNMVPKVDKIVVNVGLGEALTNAKAIDAASGDLTMITGQKPIVMKARRSIAQFRVRTGNPIGLKVTLRGQRMWDFLERLTMLALPRIRDFRGTPSRSFDGRGNYTLGLREQIAFPEIDYDKVDRLRGLEVSIVTTAKSDEESKRLLELLGMPFAG